MEYYNPELQEPIPKVFTQRMADRRTELLAAQTAAQAAEMERLEMAGIQAQRQADREREAQEARDAAIMDYNARNLTQRGLEGEALRLEKQKFDPSVGGPFSIGGMMGI